MSIETITAALQHGPMSTAELTQMLRLSKTSITNSLRIMRRRKTVYISVYERTQEDSIGGSYTPYYALGSKKDAEWPTPISIPEQRVRYRIRHSAMISARRYPHLRESMGVWAGLGGRA